MSAFHGESSVVVFGDTTGVLECLGCTDWNSILRLVKSASSFKFSSCLACNVKGI